MTSGTPLLIVLARGVGRDDFDGAETSPPLQRPAGLRPHAELVGDDLVGTLRRLGVSVDRRSAVLRPNWRSDDAVIRELEGRPAGPADITFLELRDVQTAATLDGPGSTPHQRALDRLPAHVEQARQLLRRRGEPPRTCLLGLGPVRHTGVFFDVHAQLPRALRRRLGPASRWLHPAAITIDCGSWRDLRALAATLSSREFRRHGRLLGHDEEHTLELPPQPARLHFIARPGTAFTPVRGVVPFIPEPADSGFAQLPWSSDRPLQRIADIAARVLIEAATLAESQPVPEPAATTSPDIRALLEHVPFANAQLQHAPLKTTPV